jgi:hypothetical protein
MLDPMVTSDVVTEAQNLLYYDRKTMRGRDAHIVLNFSGHPVRKHLYPERYIFIECPMQVNLLAEDVDIKIADYIIKRLADEGIDNLNFIPIIINPSYKALIVPLIYIIANLFGGKLPIVSTLLVDKKDNDLKARYLIPSMIKARVRASRPEYKHFDGLIID